MLLLMSGCTGIGALKATSAKKALSAEMRMGVVAALEGGSEVLEEAKADARGRRR